MMRIKKPKDSRPKRCHKVECRDCQGAGEVDHGIWQCMHRVKRVEHPANVDSKYGMGGFVGVCVDCGYYWFTYIEPPENSTHMPQSEPIGTMEPEQGWRPKFSPCYWYEDEQHGVEADNAKRD